MSKTNESLMQRRVAAVPRGVGQIHPIFADHAKNSSVVDVEGREFIDAPLSHKGAYLFFRRELFLLFFLLFLAAGSALPFLR